ncbi:hypothetical protein RYX36_005897 [Vicia faba]
MASSSLQQEKGIDGDDTKNIVLKKGKWQPEEDALLREYVRKCGAKKWDKFPGRTDNELKNFINSRKRSLKNSRKFLVPESINHVDELNENVGEIIIKRGCSNQNNNASEEKEMTLPRVKFDDKNILFDNYLDQIFDEENINFEPLSKLFDDSNMNFEPLPECSYFQDMENIVPSFSYTPIPQCPYNLDMDYQFASGMFSDQYPQNPIISSEETQYEMLEPWLLAECVPLW